MGVYGVGVDPNAPPPSGGASPTFITQADFDLAYQPTTQAYAGTASGSYLVQAGDTLKGIALAAYGDASLWYVIAQANGLSSDQDLRAGETLTIPSQVGGTHNTASTHAPYNPAKIVGSTQPNLPIPQAAPADSGGGCGGMGMIIMIVVAIVVTCVSAGTLGPVMVAAMTESLGALGATMVAGAAIGVMSSVASQAVGMAIGAQHGFNWSAVGMAAVGGAISAGVTGLPSATTGQMTGGLMSGSTGTVAVAEEAMVTDAATQGADILVGYQNGFNWKEMAGAGVGAFASSEFLKATNDDSVKTTNWASSNRGGWAGRGLNAASGFINEAASTGVRNGSVDMSQVARDAFGNALGNSIASPIVQSVQEERLAKLKEKAQEQDWIHQAADLLGKALSDGVDAKIQTGIAAPSGSTPLIGAVDDSSSGSSGYELTDIDGFSSRLRFLVAPTDEGTRPKSLEVLSPVGDPTMTESSPADLPGLPGIPSGYSTLPNSSSLGILDDLPTIPDKPLLKFPSLEQLGPISPEDAINTIEGLEAALGGSMFVASRGALPYLPDVIPVDSDSVAAYFDQIDSNLKIQPYPPPLVSSLQLSLIMPNATPDNISKYIDPINQTLAEFHLTTPERIAAFIANVKVETASLSSMQEQLNYSKADLLASRYEKYFGPKGDYDANDYLHNGEALANLVYSGRYGNGDVESGDGWAYSGKGAMHLTWKSNYEEIGEMLGVNLLEDPNILVRDPLLAMRSGGAYFMSKVDYSLLDAGDITDINIKVNGGTNGMQDRIDTYYSALGVLLPLPKLDFVPVPSLHTPEVMPISYTTPEQYSK